MKWITREKVKVDRVACPWLIRKFIDPEAVFVFMAAEEVMSRAAELGDAIRCEGVRTRPSRGGRDELGLLVS